MPEMLKTYSLEGEYLGQLEKKEAHERMRKEYFETGKVTTRHKHVRLLLMTSMGRVILQRRSKWKGDNPGKWDKTIGGHVTEDDSYDLSILKECAEELGIPSTIVKEEEFSHTIKVTDLNVLAVLTKAKYLDNFQSVRADKNGAKWVEPNMTQFYIGYYDGAIRFIDKESCGIQVFTMEEITQEINENPDAFTDDVKYMINTFRPMLAGTEKKREKELND